MNTFDTFYDNEITDELAALGDQAGLAIEYERLQARRYAALQEPNVSTVYDLEPADYEVAGPLSKDQAEEMINIELKNLASYAHLKEGIENEITILSGRLASAKATIERCKDRIGQVLSATSLASMKTPLATISVREGKERLIVTATEAEMRSWPNEVFRAACKEEMVVKLSKEKLREKLEEWGDFAPRLAGVDKAPAERIVVVRRA